jgi:hypothetical protein
LCLIGHERKSFAMSQKKKKSKQLYYLNKVFAICDHQKTKQNKIGQNLVLQS